MDTFAPDKPPVPPIHSALQNLNTETLEPFRELSSEKKREVGVRSGSTQGNAQLVHSQGNVLAVQIGEYDS